MRLGIGSYTYGWASGTYGPELTKDRDRLTAIELVDRAANHDVPVVQIVNLPSLDSMDSQKLADLRQYGEERGVAFEIGTVGSDPEVLRRWIRAGRILEAPLLRTVVPNPSAGLLEERKQLSEISTELEDSGITLAIENHETYSIDDLLGLLDALGDTAGVCLDTVNSLGRGEGVREVVDALLPRTVNLHIKDFCTTRGNTDMGFTVTGAVTGEGRLDIPWLLSRAAAVDPDMSVILEQWTPLGASIEESIAEQERWAEIGISYLANLIV